MCQVYLIRVTRVKTKCREYCRILPFLEDLYLLSVMNIYSTQRELDASVPNRPVRPALGTAGLWESGFPKKNAPAGFRFFNPNLNAILQIKVRVDTRDFRCCDHVH